VTVRPEIVNGTVIGGVSGQQTRFLLDGVDITEEHQGGTWIETSVDALQEFSVQQNAYSAEFHGAGGTFNAITKSGSNRCSENPLRTAQRLSASSSARPRGLDDSNPFLLLSLSATLTPIQCIVATNTTSGPHRTQSQMTTCETHALQTIDRRTPIPISRTLTALTPACRERGPGLPDPDLR